ncbi:MAG: YbhB/YbcL family Raf kinase inhibitor-like protein [Burkholderiaceae bacterium]
MEIGSSAFSEGGEIPRRHTQEGEDLSPPLTWSGVPGQARSLVLIADDPDAPDPAAPTMTWVHWLVFNLPPSSTGLAEGVQTFPPGTGHGRNDRHDTAWHGPRPPIGRHRYFFRLFALDTVLALSGQPSRAQIDAAMSDHILARAQLMGTYQRQTR